MPCFNDRVMGEASDDIKLTHGSVIEIARLPGYTLETKGKGTRARTSKLSRFSSDKKFCFVDDSDGRGGKQGRK